MKALSANRWTVDGSFEMMWFISLYIIQPYNSADKAINAAASLFASMRAPCPTVKPDPSPLIAQEMGVKSEAFTVTEVITLFPE